MRFLCALAALVLSFSSSAQGQIRAVRPPHTAAANEELGSSGIDAGDYLYVSGQGPLLVDGSTPANFADQVRQSLDNIKSVVQAAGLTMAHVVYVQVYLRNINRYVELNNVFADYFPSDPPARAVLGVARLPQEEEIQINAVAVRDLKGKQPVSEPNSPLAKGYSPGMLTYDRLFVSTMPGNDVSTETDPQDSANQVNLALNHMSSVLQAAGLTMPHMAYVNAELTSDVPMLIIKQYYDRPPQ